MAQAGSVLQDIGVTMKRREDVIDRTVRARDFDAFARESLTALETQDLARKDTVDQYSQGLRAKMDELMAGHAGTASSKAEFRNQLENQVSQYEQGARAAQVKAQHTMLGTMIEQRTNELAIDAGFAPDMLGEIFTQLDADIDQFSDALPAEMVQQYKNSGRSAIAASSIERLMANGQIDAAEAVLKNPEIGKFVNPDASRKFTIKIGAEQGKRAERQQQIEARIARMKIVMPNMTPEQEQVIRNMPPKSERTPFDDIAEWSMLNPGKPVPQSYIDQAYGFTNSGIGSNWGNSIDGRAYSTLENLATRYSMGMTTPEEDRQWQIATDILGRSKQTTDVMGKPVTIAGSLPSFVTQANQMRRGAPPAVVPPAPAMPPVGAPAMPAAPMGGGGGQVDNSFIDSQGRLDFNAIPPDAQPAAAPGGRVYESAQASGGAGLTASMSAMELAPFITGPAAKLIAQPAGAIPGRPFDVDPRYREAQTRMNVIHDRASNALRPEGKIADQYRQELNKITSLRGQVFDNEENYYQHVTALDQNWRKMVKELDKIASGEVVSSATGAREAADLANDLRFIIREFNVPQVRVYTREQLEKLPPGTPVFIGNSFKPNYRK
jgi:hypothetical protein